MSQALPPPDEPVYVTYWTTLTIVTQTPHGKAIGDIFTVSGNSLYNGTFQVLSIVNATTLKVSFYNSSAAVGNGGQLTGLLPGLVRLNNVVTATCPNPHNFYKGLKLTISGIANTNLANISAIARVSGVVTVTTSSPHGLSSNDNIAISGVVTTSFNGNQVVASVIDSTHFTYIQSGLVDASDATGTVQDIWSGPVYVASVPTATTFTYSQIGPNNNTSQVGLATPVGQVDGGIRRCVCMFQTRQGFITAPSPYVQFIGDGGKHILVTNLPIGPPNVIARILAFTGVDGGNYFYIPASVQVNGQQIATSTVVDDNTSTSALLDFSDNSLFAGIAIDITGNNLFAQVTLSPCVGVYRYASRMLFWGDRNKVLGLLNMGFEGGYVDPTKPLGWNVDGTGGVVIAGGDFGGGWAVQNRSGFDTGRIYQFIAQDQLGSEIILPSTQYTFGCWVQACKNNQNGYVLAELVDINSGTVLATAQINLNTSNTLGMFFQVPFSAPTPIAIPAQLALRVSVQNLDINDFAVLDELDLVYTNQPYRDGLFRFSYVDNPEALDGVTGNLGSSDDSSPLMCCFEYHDTLHFLSNRSLHDTRDVAGLEPSGWTVNEISSRCGAASPRACDIGENFAAWVASPGTEPPSGRGVYVYTGGVVYKISQEVQPQFDAINTTYERTIWLRNDPINRRIYIGVPTGNFTAPNQLYVLDYRELDTAAELADKTPIHISFTGKLICSDLSRKWTKWNVMANCAEPLIRGNGNVQMCFGGGNGFTPGSSTNGAFGNVYYLDSTKLTDDDYGLISPYYTTFFFVEHDVEASSGLGYHRKLFKRWSGYFTGVGQLQIIPMTNGLQNQLPALPLWPLKANQPYDIGDGMNVQAERCAFRFGSIPLPNQTDNSFNTGKFIVTLSQEPVAPIRYGAL